MPSLTNTYYPQAGLGHPDRCAVRPSSRRFSSGPGVTSVEGPGARCEALVGPSGKVRGPRGMRERLLGPAPRPAVVAREASLPLGRCVGAGGCPGVWHRVGRWLGVALVTAMWASGVASAGTRPTIEEVTITRDARAITATYRFRGEYDPSRVELSRKGEKLFITFPGATYTRSVGWIPGGGKAFRHSKVTRGRGKVVHMIRFRRGYEFPKSRIRVTSGEPGEVVVRFWRPGVAIQETTMAGERAEQAAVARSRGQSGERPGGEAEGTGDIDMEKVLAVLAAPARPAHRQTEAATRPAGEQAAKGEGPAAKGLGGLAKELSKEVEPPAAPAGVPSARTQSPARASLPIAGVWDHARPVVFGLALVILAGLALPVARRLKIAKPGRERARFRVVERVALGPKHQLCLVDVGSRYLVVGTGEGGVSLLTELPGDEVVPGAPSGGEPAPGQAPVEPAAGDRGFMQVLAGLVASRGKDPAPADAPAPDTPGWGWDDSKRGAKGPSIEELFGRPGRPKVREPRRGVEPKGLSKRLGGTSKLV